MEKETYNLVFHNANDVEKEYQAFEEHCQKSDCKSCGYYERKRTCFVNWLKKKAGDEAKPV